MDKGLRRIRCNPDGSILFKRWNNTLVVKGKFDAIFETASGYEQTAGERKEYYAELLEEMMREADSLDHLHVVGLDTNQIDYREYRNNGWETELQY
ncbi:hypothetical protein KHA93_01535 [Bacillus sp. FJAT-49732]|uniref:Uncharacterized protein n=1 Tax=Lederbergia citrisecunda TaxID=2833583 RepID=A0A942THT9_9BACI|nr:hypothetical protein [Lederbergia citrisecunda]MBS4198341.1 hypothetical protein [Lederbergia citrisecunda]